MIKQRNYNYLIFKKNLNNLFSSIFFKEHVNFDKIIQNKKNTTSNSKFDSRQLNNVRISGNLADLHEEKVLFCSFHLGFYPIVLHFLNKFKSKITIIVNFQNKEHEDLFKQNFHKFQYSNTVDFVNIYYSNALIKLKENITKGHSIVIYCDANLNMARSPDKKTEVVNFLGTQIKVMRGVQVISRLFKLNILPILTYELDAENHIVLENIIPHQHEANVKTQKIWALLEKYIHLFPNQWEGWLFDSYIKADEKLSYVKLNNYLSFNFKQFDLFSDINNFYIYNKNNFYFIEINKNLFDFLCKIYKKKLTIHEYIYIQLFGYEQLEELKKKNILN